MVTVEPLTVAPSQFTVMESPEKVMATAEAASTGLRSSSAKLTESGSDGISAICWVVSEDVLASVTEFVSTVALAEQAVSASARMSRIKNVFFIIGYSPLFIDP